ncbi:NB-ARC domain-containing protein [Streptomyces sp. NPDC001027]|uniref:tetratricopeptide repeat protein n=1 Tax=Streptomyces sp. NPDC001027 TaxID=3154771 RepID=UPI0033274B91
MEALVALYRSVLAERQVLVVLDNVRSYAQLRTLLPGSRRCAVLVTSRDQLEELVTWPQEARVHLGVLPEPEAVELLGRIVGTERIASARADTVRLAELCDRLPLALRIAAYALLGLGESRLGADEVEAAATTLTEALEIVEHIDSPLVDGRINLVLGDTLRRLGRHDAARERLTAAHDVFVRVDAPQWRAEAERALARLEIEEG